MKEEELNLENIKSKIKKFKWINRIIIITITLTILISMYRISNFNDGHYLFGISVTIILPICIIAVSIIHNKIYKNELKIKKIENENASIKRKIKEDNERINNILENEELMNKIKEKIKSDEEHKN